MTVARLALVAKSEREGGYPMALKPLAARLLGTAYAAAGKEIDNALSDIWSRKLKELAIMLRPYGVTRRQINETLKDVTGSLDAYSEQVQTLWYDWNITSKITYADVPKPLLQC